MGYSDSKHKDRKNDNPLHRMEKDVCIKYLERAVEITKSEKLRVKVCSAVDNRDTTAIDVTYHKECWTNNVFHITEKRRYFEFKTI